MNTFIHFHCLCKCKKHIFIILIHILTFKILKIGMENEKYGYKKKLLVFE